MSNSKARFLAIQVRLGNITVEQVPAEHREDVERILGK